MNESTAAKLAELLTRHQRVGVTGPPRSGKTTLVLGNDFLSLPVVHGDDFKDLGWSESSQALADAGNVSTVRVVEGVQVPRAIRKGLKLDALLVLTEPLVDLTPGQESMAKGVTTVLRDCMERGLLDGVDVVFAGGAECS